MYFLSIWSDQRGTSDPLIFWFPAARILVLPPHTAASDEGRGKSKRTHTCWESSGKPAAGQRTQQRSRPAGSLTQERSITGLSRDFSDFSMQWQALPSAINTQLFHFQHIRLMAAELNFRSVLSCSMISWLKSICIKYLEFCLRKQCNVF